MNVYFENNGDKLGEMHLVDIWRCEKRELIRRGLLKTFKFLGKEVRVRFQDECGDCGWPLIRGRCHNDDCIVNLPDDEENVTEMPDISEQLDRLKGEFNGL